MNSKTIILRGFQIVAVIFAGFNGFINDWGPPIDAFSKTSFEVGFTSFLAFIILLIIFSISKYYPNLIKKKGWISISIFFFVTTIVLGVTYRTHLREHIVEFPKGSMNLLIIGNDYTKSAKTFMEDNNITSNNEVIGAFGGASEINRVWETKSINRVIKIISALYIMFVLSICISIFCITEGVLMNS